MIQIKNVTKNYFLGNLRINALNRINITINKGDFYVIVGPSGSGKSTLMNIIGCLDVPTSGKYFLEGEEINKLNENRLAQIRNNKIGFIFQKFNLLPRLNAFENVELPLIYRGMHEKVRKKRVEEVISLVRLTDRIMHRPNELSGGQQQRIAIARALASNPQLILADEPTGNLDTKTGEEIIKILKDLNEKGITVVIITHDNLVADKCDNVITLKDGKIC